MRKPFSKIQFCAIIGLLVLPVPITNAGQEPSLTLAQLFDGTRVLVLPFRNISGDPSTDWVGAGIAEAVAADLPPTTEIVLLDADQVPPETGDTAEAATAGRRAGARWAIHGGYQQVGSQLRITARVIDCETGAVVRSGRVDGGFDELFTLQDRIVPGLATPSIDVESNPALRPPVSPTTPAELAAAPGASGVDPASPPDTTLAPGGRLATVAGVPLPPELPNTMARNAAGLVTVRAVRVDGV